MKPKTYEVLARCVEEGIASGHARAYKHTDNPTPDMVNQAIYHAVMLSITEYFYFEDIKE